MSKFFLLGLDGLEYDFVEKWHLTHLQQSQYGKLKVPISKEFGIPTSPEVWASFLTGKNVKKEFGRTFRIQMMLKVAKFMRKHVKIGFGLGSLLRKRSPARFPSLKEKTFLDITRSKAINVPYYSFDHGTFDISHRFTTGKISLEEAERELNLVYQNSKKRILNETETRDLDLIFAFMHFPDYPQHLLMMRPQKIKILYHDLDNYVSTLKKRIPKSFTYIIVSDHGFNPETKTHSKHGFYSSNITLNPTPRRITDFYEIFTGSIDRSDPKNIFFQDPKINEKNQNRLRLSLTRSGIFLRALRNG